MKFFKMTALIALPLISAGCSGKLYTSNQTAFDDNGNMQGVQFYPPALFKETTKTTVAIKDGKIVGRAADGSCEPVASEKIITAPDYSQPRRIWYDHGLLESYTFGVTLDAAGDLTAVNNQSTPDQGKTFENIATGIGALAPLATALAVRPSGTAQVACTDGPVVVGRSKFP
jgi:hypothetical protein